MIDQDLPRFYWERTAVRYFELGRICLSIYMLAGWWYSLGCHLSLVPLYVDLHILWFVISLMGRERGRIIRGYDEMEE